MKILVVAAHPAYERSVVNRALSRAISGEKGIKLHDLYETYPDFQIDIAREQALLLRYDVIVLQHPFFWYSAPALIKEWIDLVLEHGWAYGKEGDALAGKFMMNALSTGGGPDAYRSKGTNRHTIPQFLAPFNQTARLCNMTYLPPFVVYEGRRLEREELRRAGEEYRAILTGLRDEKIDPHALARYELCNNAVGKLAGLEEAAP
ncbi:MAG: NAD(P)H-dependent oxidoreductase [Hyphomicrobiales bacterium]